MMIILIWKSHGVALDLNGRIFISTGYPSNRYHMGVYSPVPTGGNNELLSKAASRVMMQSVSRCTIQEPQGQRIFVGTGTNGKYTI